MTSRSRPFPWLGYLVTFLLIMAVSLSPVLVLIYVNATSGQAPLDLAGLMASWGILGYLLLAPFVIGGALFLLWLFAIPAHLLARHRLRSRP
jgi:hypothetical protein